MNGKAKIILNGTDGTLIPDITPINVDGSKGKGTCIGHFRTHRETAIVLVRGDSRVVFRFRSLRTVHGNDTDERQREADFQDVLSISKIHVRDEEVRAKTVGIQEMFKPRGRDVKVHASLNGSLIS